MQYQVKGTVMPHLEIQLGPGESVYTESGAMAWMDANVEMTTTGRGDLGGMLKRMVTSESVFVTNFRSESGGDMVAFVSEIPGAIVPVELREGESIIAQKDSFLVAEQSVEFSAVFTKRIGGGLLGRRGVHLATVRRPRGSCLFRLGAKSRNTTWRQDRLSRWTPGTSPCSSRAWTMTYRWLRVSATSCLAERGCFWRRSPVPEKSGCSGCPYATSPRRYCGFCLGSGAGNQRSTRAKRAARGRQRLALPG